MIKIECDTEEEYLNCLDSLSDRGGVCPINCDYCDEYNVGSYWESFETENVEDVYMNLTNCVQCLQEKITWVIKENQND